MVGFYNQATDFEKCVPRESIVSKIKFFDEKHSCCIDANLLPTDKKKKSELFKVQIK